MGHVYQFFKVSLIFTTITGTGFFLLLKTTPTEEEYLKTLEENNILTKAEYHRRQKEYGIQIQKIIENSKEDRPIWDIDWSKYK
jgi:hypothetical protein